MKIYKNFLDKNYLQEIQNVLYGERTSFPWYYLNYLVSTPKKDNISNFYHIAYQFYRPTSDYFNLFETLINKINPAALIRIRLNLYPKTGKSFETVFHTDVNDIKNYKTAIFYLNNNNGYTIFKDKKIKSEENTLVEFDGQTLHKGVSATDNKKVLININYISK
tara:strand:+ start:1145 stop:1636 length:492 start_codon:yes stop_codon:yes gene_type:complete